jgi:hypothetical protein
VKRLLARRLERDARLKLRDIGEARITDRTPRARDTTSRTTDSGFSSPSRTPRAIPKEIDVVENWFEELKAKVPVK